MMRLTQRARRRLVVIVLGVVLAVGLSAVLRAETYRVTVTRIDRNLYLDVVSKTIIETRVCMVRALRDEAVLHWEGRHGDSWLKFRDETCRVIALR